jgi:hypothetical protein
MTHHDAHAYTLGWNACMAGEDGRFTNPYERRTDLAYAWNHGFLDAMDAEDNEEPRPETAGYLNRQAMGA